ncbi:Fic family protein [Oerskovia sp. M15]
MLVLWRCDDRSDAPRARPGRPRGTSLGGGERRAVHPGPGHGRVRPVCLDGPRRDRRPGSRRPERPRRRRRGGNRRAHTLRRVRTHRARRGQPRTRAHGVGAAPHRVGVVLPDREPHGGARQLALAEIDQSTSANAQTVVANVRAMEAALALADRLDETAILTMQHELLSGQRGWEQHAGRYRDGLVWVGTSSISPRGASHVAPQPELVAPAMRDLVDFMHRDDLPVLVQAAVAHAQFETIHPFVDGNGRTGAPSSTPCSGPRGRSDTPPPPSRQDSWSTPRPTSRRSRPFAGRRSADRRAVRPGRRYAARSGARLVDDLGRRSRRRRSSWGACVRKPRPGRSSPPGRPPRRQCGVPDRGWG